MIQAREKNSDHKILYSEKTKNDDLVTYGNENDENNGIYASGG